MFFNLLKCMEYLASAFCMVEPFTHTSIYRRINYAKLREFLCIYCNRKSDEAIQIRVKSITTIGIS